jgi:hypothetical protein
VNLEFPRLPLQHSVHSEQFLVTNAAWHGETSLKRITLNAAPCGHCRQFLAELVDAVRTQALFPCHFARCRPAGTIVALAWRRMHACHTANGMPLRLQVVRKTFRAVPDIEGR